MREFLKCCIKEIMQVSMKDVWLSLNINGKIWIEANENEGKYLQMKRVTRERSAVKKEKETHKYVCVKGEDAVEVIRYTVCKNTGLGVDDHCLVVIKRLRWCRRAEVETFI